MPHSEDQPPVFTQLNDSESCVSGQILDRDSLHSHWRDLHVSVYWGVAAYILILLIGVPLNLYIITVIAYKRLYSVPTYLLLLNLGITDLLMCPFIAYQVITQLRGEISFGPTNYIRCQVCSNIIGQLAAVEPLLEAIPVQSMIKAISSGP